MLCSSWMTLNSSFRIFVIKTHSIQSLESSVLSAILTWEFLIYRILHVRSFIYALVLGELLAIFAQHWIRMMFNQTDKIITLLFTSSSFNTMEFSLLNFSHCFPLYNLDHKRKLTQVPLEHNRLYTHIYFRLLTATSLSSFYCPHLSRATFHGIVTAGISLRQTYDAISVPTGYPYRWVFLKPMRKRVMQLAAHAMNLQWTFKCVTLT